MHLWVSVRPNAKFAAIIAFLSIISGWQTTAYASFLDSDFWCRTYGCVVVHDGQNYDIYDNYQFSQGQCCVPNGTPMIPYTRRFGEFNLTGSLDANQAPNADQSMMFGIAQNGVITQSLQDDGNGFLDASDSFATGFVMNSTTDIALDGPGRQYSHSFFISSRNTRFSIRGLSSINSATQDFATTLSLDNIRIDTSFSRRGNDDGFRYGRRARTNNINVFSNINDLGDLQATPTRVFQFNRFSGIRRRNGNLNDQTIRLDFLYTMPQYDMSMGVGSLNIDVIYDIYKEP